MTGLKSNPDQAVTWNPQAWRSELRNRLAARGAPAAESQRQTLQEKISSLVSRRPGLWLGFRSLPGEPSLPSAIPGVTWAFPVTEAESALEFYRWDDPRHAPVFKFNRWKIEEPETERSGWRKIDFAAPELRGVLIPALGFDSRLGRLGRGGGYYDRFLARLRAKRGAAVVFVGVGFSEQWVERLPRQPHDVDLDGWITDRSSLWRLKGERDE